MASVLSAKLALGKVLTAGAWVAVPGKASAEIFVPGGTVQLASGRSPTALLSIVPVRSVLYRGLGAGLHLAPGPKAGTKVKEEPIEQRPLAKGPPPGLSAKAKAAPAEESEYSFEEEEESEEEGATLASAVDPRPSLPRSRVPRTDASPVGAGLPSGAGESRAPSAS